MNDATASVEQKSPARVRVKPRRRWLQFSLRTLLILIAVATIPFYQGVRWIQQSVDEEHAIATLAKNHRELVQISYYAKGDPRAELNGPPRWFLKLCGRADFPHVSRIAFIDLDLSWNARRPNVGTSTIYDQYLVDDVPFRRVISKDIELLKHIRSPFEVEFRLDVINEDMLALLAPNPAIESIRLDAAWFKDRKVIRILSTMPNLKELCLESVSFPHLGGHPVEGFQELRRLTLDNCLLADDDLEQIGSLKAVEQLKLINYSDNAPNYYSQAPDLIQKSTITDSGLRHLSGLSHLKVLVLELRGQKINGEGFERFSSVPLESLTFYGSTVSDQALLHIAECRQLTEIDLSPVQASVESIERLLALPGLKSVKLRMSGSEPSQAAVDQLIRNRLNPGGKQ